MSMPAPQLSPAIHDYIEQFRTAICNVGLIPPDVIESDGKLHRFASNGKGSDDAGWYVLHNDGIPAGAFGNWRTGASETWRANIGRGLSPMEETRHRARLTAIRREREVEEAKRKAGAREKAAAIWQAAGPVSDDHEYLRAKGVKAHGLRITNGALVVPMSDGEEVHSLQFIASDGSKKFLTGGRVSGCYFLIGKPDGVLYIAEGYATGASIHEATGHAVAVAFNAGNLVPVARKLRQKFPEMRLILCADDDAKTDGNPGLTKAREAAQAVGGLVAVPDFGADRPGGATDFNDLYRHAGPSALLACIERAGDVSEVPQIPTVTPPEAVAVDGAEVLSSVRTFIRRFCAFPDAHCLTAVTLWAAHAHIIEHFHISPRLNVISPELGSGKTRVLEVLELLTPDPLMCLSPSPAAVFRQLGEQAITLLFDEVDTIFKSKGKDDAHEDLRGLLNAGYKRGATIPRCVGPKHEVIRFPVFAATALAGIGDLPDTIMSRAIIIRMRRRAPDEQVEPFRLRVNEPEGHAIRDILATWCKTVGVAVGAAWPQLPDGIVDRPAEIWEPLIAIADAAGGDWPELARSACVALCKVAAERKASLGIRLLSDLRIIFGDSDAVHTVTILERLCNGDEYGLDADAPWSDLYGKALTDRGLARMLDKYGVKPLKVKVAGKALMGYRREHLWDAWRRYLPAGAQSVEPAEPPEPEADLGEILRSAPFGAPAGVPFEVPLTGTHPEPVRNLEIAERCNVDDLTAKVPEVPEVPLPAHPVGVATEELYL